MVFSWSWYEVIAGRCTDDTPGSNMVVCSYTLLPSLPHEWRDAVKSSQCVVLHSCL